MYSYMLHHNFTIQSISCHLFSITANVQELFIHNMCNSIWWITNIFLSLEQWCNYSMSVKYSYRDLLRYCIRQEWLYCHLLCYRFQIYPINDKLCRNESFMCRWNWYCLCYCFRWNNTLQL